MTRSNAGRSANLLAVVALGLSDRIRQAEETAAGHSSAVPSALVALHQFLEGASIDDLHHVVGLTPSGTVRMVDKLSAAGLVERRRGRDMRSVSVVLTPRGREVAGRILAARRQASEAIFAGLSTRELTSLTSLLERLLEELTMARLTERRSGVNPTGGWLCRLCDFSACGREKGMCPVANVVAPAPSGSP